ncbi:AMP-binding protein [Aliifodinibius salipaludis]|uniref:AMP-binding protein n=1 Tax=Fodinibius salipaludis TaxID=2032627 RepID=UPI0020D0C008|nr:AMP-binding protein [Aliifodinibius salipaludis]
MTNSDQIPIFSAPREDDLFLGSSFGLHSYGDLKQFERFFLQFLFDFDHNFEKPVGFLAPSSDTLIFAIAACWNLGIPFVSFDTKATSTELNRQFEQVDPGLIFANQALQSKIDHRDTIDIKQLDLTRSLDIDVVLGFEAKNYSPTTEPDNIFGYFFTSGTTTGTPKIVPLKRRQMLFAAKSSAKNFKPRKNHFWLLCMPLNHIGGISIILRSLLYGSAIFRMKSFHPKMIATFLTENKLFQAASLVPTMLRRLLERSDFFVHQNFKAILLGGGPVNTDLIKECRNKGIPLVPSYGMTETCAQIAANPILKPSGTYGPLKSVGTVFEPNHIQIRDENDKAASINTTGEIWIKGPQVFDGYLNLDNKNFFDEDGWFRTGDFGYFNAKNQLFIDSRRSDRIVTGGENVSPFEVESKLNKLTHVKEAAVFGITDNEWGQKVAAVVVTKNGEPINSASIKESLKQSLADYKVPKEIIQVDTLPKTRTDKVIRSKLPELFLDQAEQKGNS